MVTIFGEGDTDRVADPVGEERADPNSTLDATIFTITRFGDAEMNRIIPVGAFCIQPRHKQAVGGDHDLGVGGLHGKDHLVEIEITRNPGKLQSALDHSKRRVTESVHDPVAQRSVVGTDPHRDAALLTELHQWGEALANPFQFVIILRIGVVTDIELLGVGEVSRIDPHFFNPLDRLKRGIWLEVDVGDQGDVTAAPKQLLANALQVRCILHRRRGDPHHLAPNLSQTECLFDTGLGIHRVAGDHRLHPNGIGTTKGNSSHHHLSTHSTRVGEEVRHVGGRGPGSHCGVNRSAHGLIGAGDAAEAAGEEKVIVSEALSAPAADFRPMMRSPTSKKET